MSGVVLRCPHCGTTRAAPGECDACHEAEVRWFCRNHEAGRWIDAPPCPDCGAGVERATPAPSPPPRRRPTAPPSFDAPPRPMAPPRPTVDDPWEVPPWASPREPAGVDRPDDAGLPPGWGGGPPPTIHVRPLPILGCVGRLLTYVVMAVVLLAMATCWFFGGGVMVGVAPAEHRRVARSEHHGVVPTAPARVAPTWAAAPTAVPTAVAARR